MASIDIKFGYTGSFAPGSVGDKRWVCADLSRPDAPTPPAGKVYHLSAYGAVMVETGEDDDITEIHRAFSSIPSAVPRSDSAIRRFITEAISYCHTCSTLVWLVNTRAYRAVVCSDGVEITAEPIYRGSIFSLEYADTPSGIYVTVVSGPLPKAERPKPKPVEAVEPEEPDKPEEPIEPEEPVEPIEPVEPVEPEGPSAARSAFVEVLPPPEPEMPRRSRKWLWIAILAAAVAIILVFLFTRGCSRPVAEDEPVSPTLVDTVAVEHDTRAITDTVAAEPADTVAVAEVEPPAETPAPAPTKPVVRTPKASNPEPSTSSPETSKKAPDGHGANYTIEPGTADEE